MCVCRFLGEGNFLLIFHLDLEFTFTLLLLLLFRCAPSPWNRISLTALWENVSKVLDGRPPRYGGAAKRVGRTRTKPGRKKQHTIPTGGVY